jgi:hypothetical protein
MAGVALLDCRFDSVSTPESCTQSTIYTTSANPKSSPSRIRQANGSLMFTSDRWRILGVAIRNFGEFIDKTGKLFYTFSLLLTNKKCSVERAGC